MSRLLNSVLDRVSENNNEYRKELQNLYKSIEEKTTSIIGDIVTLSNYTLDFSNSITSAKEELVNPISRIIESYAIKDLRSVEAVNEQFIDKINDKLDNAEITSSEEKDKFINSLNTLLNDKYLEIVRIKRVDFVAIDGTNSVLEDTVNSYINNLTLKANFDVARLNELFVSYKKDIYALVNDSLNKISNLYLSNFVNEVIASLNGIIDISAGADSLNYNENIATNVPNMNIAPVIPDVPEIPDIPVISEVPVIDQAPIIPEIPEVPEIPNSAPIMSFDNVDIQSASDVFAPSFENDEEINKDTTSQLPAEPYNPMERAYASPVEPEAPQARETKKYDVEEILKIAKSPIVNISEEEPKEDSYLSIKPIEHVNETKEIELEFDEKEIVEEMIRRLSNRLEMINEKQEQINEQEQKIDEDETFVNDLIESSNNKRLELDNLEKELDAKELELSEKQKELDKKLNDVLPFANAIMKNEETN